MRTVDCSLDLAKILIKHLLGMVFGIVEMNPVFTWKLNRFRILLDLVPVGLVPHVTRGLSSLLHSSYTVISDIGISSHSDGSVYAVLIYLML